MSITKARKTKAEAIKPKPKSTTKTKTKSKVELYVSVKAELVHPFAKVRIPVGAPGVELDRDSWLDSQIGVGLVKQL